ncbi:MAG: hypothetical protein EA386_14565 [Rhodobacteraceae bacterium]|nr:MAG: hypothetical protein EA386_14565 [Paracoccaceae bacterium]
MTLGIGIAGSGAGRAALAALRMVEHVGRGMIGGFVSLAALDAKGNLHRAETGRGGVAALFAGAVPDVIANAPVVVLMSSGPDRLPPLSQFTPAAAGVACVSGHRLPNMPAVPGGDAVNALALARIAQSASAQSVLDGLFTQYPQADAGLIAVTAAGEVAAANSALVAARTDAGGLMTQSAGLKIAILHNAIFPVNGLADIAAGAAIDSIAPADAHDFEITISAGVRLSTAAPGGVDIDADGRVTRIGGLHEGWLASVWQGAAAMRASPVLRNGRQVGTLVSEAYCIAYHGVLQSCDGLASVRLRVRATGPLMDHKEDSHEP